MGLEALLAEICKVRAAIEAMHETIRVDIAQAEAHREAHKARIEEVNRKTEELMRGAVAVTPSWPPRGH